MEGRITTGDEDFDSMLGGGIPEGNQVLLAGTAGAGKTLLSIQILYKNAKEGRKGFIISLEELREQIISEAKSAFPEFTELDKFLDSEKIEIFDIEMFRDMLKKEMGENSRKDFISLAASQRQALLYSFCKKADFVIKGLLSDSKTDIAVIDNVGILRDLFDDEVHFRQFMIELQMLLKSSGVTGIYVTEHIKDKPAEQEFFTFDGVITMYTLFDSTRRIPVLEVNKMRKTEHSFSTAPYEITPSGIKLITTEFVRKHARSQGNVNNHI